MILQVLFKFREFDFRLAVCAYFKIILKATFGSTVKQCFANLNIHFQSRTVYGRVVFRVYYRNGVSILFTALFLFFGRLLGKLLYQNELAGNFIMVLGFLCPLMYIASTLGSILNGLGKTGLTFAYSMASLLVRLLFVFFVIPLAGINGYLWGLLVSQLVQTLLCLYAVRRYY